MMEWIKAKEPHNSNLVTLMHKYPLMDPKPAAMEIIAEVHRAFISHFS
jgi:hypothetical protein